MSTAVFTPKQVATALGVSESSVKRWVDSGRLPAARTAGGHRKVPLPAIADFVRETGHDLARPEVLGMVAVNRRTPIDQAVEMLYQALIVGNESACRDLVLGFYQRGDSVVELGDRLVGPAMQRVGTAWESGEIRVFQERRACEVMMATLHELRHWLPAPASDAPLALVATPPKDFSEVGVRMVELALAGSGWRVIAAGSGLPIEEIRDAVLNHGPRLVCLSVAHLQMSDEDFIEAYNERLVEPTVSGLSSPVSHAIGGGALCEDLRASLRCDLFGDSLRQLVEHAGSLKTPRRASGAGATLLACEE